jgi:hypothetical protein
MDRDFAYKVCVSAIKASSMLSSNLPELSRRQKSKQETDLSVEIYQICAIISLNIVENIFNIYPDMRKEIEDKIQRDGAL